MRKLIGIFALAALVVAGCNQLVELKAYDHARFSMQVPSHWKQFDPDPDLGEIAYFSDGESAQIFYEGSVGVYVYDDFYSDDAKFDQSYCDTTYGIISNPQYLTGVKEVKKKNVEFVAANENHPAYCDISYEVYNENTDDYVAAQQQRQLLFLDGTDEVVIEIASTRNPMPDYLTKVLDSFKLKPESAADSES